MSATILLIEIDETFMANLNEEAIKKIIMEDYEPDEPDTIDSELVKVKFCLYTLLQSGVIDNSEGPVFYICRDLIDDYVVRRYDVSQWTNVIININHALKKAH